MNDLAKLAYEEFCAVLCGSAAGSIRSTPWEALPPQMRQAWIAAVATVEQQLAVGVVHGRMQ